MSVGVVNSRGSAFLFWVIKRYKSLSEEKRGFAMRIQRLRSGAAVGALIPEVEQYESKTGFIYKMGSALIEANETRCWEVMFQPEYLKGGAYHSTHVGANALFQGLTAIIKSSNQNGKR